MKLLAVVTPPSIYHNLVVEEVVLHWVAAVVERAGGQEGSGQEGQRQISLFYVDDGIVASSYPGWLQGAFDTLVGLLYQMVLQKILGRRSEWYAIPDMQRVLSWR